MKRIFYTEIIKLRRSMVLATVLGCPLLVVLLMTAMAWKQHGKTEFGPDQWNLFWLGMFALWSSFVLPLQAALLTTAVTGNEHRFQTWRLLLTLPIRPGQVYTMKAILPWLGLALSGAMLLLYGTLAVWILGLNGFSLAQAFARPIILDVLRLTIASLPLVLLQHALSWRISNVIVPLAFAVMVTLGIAQFSQSEWWLYYPWSYPLVSVNAQSLAARQQAVILAPALAAIFFFLGLKLLNRRRLGGETRIF